jgi:GMP synthase-like glutamine amidotransferase
MGPLLVRTMRPSASRNLLVAVVDNSINPSVYKPVQHWASFLPAPFASFRAPDGRLPDLGKGFTHFILTGSEASIVEREDWVRSEVEFVREALERGFPMLGSCYGHQLLALALCGPAHVRRCRRPEIGWHSIAISEKSSLLGKEGVAYAFSSHFDEVTGLDERFRVLAASADCPVQAFELKGRPVWGIQFHPEIDIPAAREYLQNLIDLGLKTSPLFIEAMQMSPRDSGLIRRIVPYFLGVRAGR